MLSLGDYASPTDIPLAVDLPLKDLEAVKKTLAHSKVARSRCPLCTHKLVVLIESDGIRKMGCANIDCPMLYASHKLEEAS